MGKLWRLDELQLLAWNGRGDRVHEVGEGNPAIVFGFMRPGGFGGSAQIDV